MKSIVIVQARMTSTRLPGKVLKILGGKPLLQNIYERLSRAKKVDQVVIATSQDSSDNAIAKMCYEHGFVCYRGSLENVLSRYYYCAQEQQADTIVRCTGDNPLVDAAIIDAAIEKFYDMAVDYLTYKARLPLGMAVEVFSFAALSKAFYEAKNPECLEHVTPYIRENPQLFHTLLYEDKMDKDRSGWRFTVDTEEDFAFVTKVYDAFSSNDFSYDDVIALMAKHPLWHNINAAVEQKHLTYRGN